MDKDKTAANVGTATPVEKSEADRNADKVAEQVNNLLKENNLALQPYLVFDERGVMPAVRLILKKEVETNVKENADTTKETTNS